MLPFLFDPAQTALRNHNFAQGGLNLQIDGGRDGPYVLGGTCSRTSVSKSVCEDNDGVWRGIGADDPSELQRDLAQCWQVSQAIYRNDPAGYADNRISMGSTDAVAQRNELFKLMVNRTLDYDIDDTDTELLIVSEEFSTINQLGRVEHLRLQPRRPYQRTRPRHPRVAEGSPLHGLHTLRDPQPIPEIQEPHQPNPNELQAQQP